MEKVVLEKDGGEFGAFVEDAGSNFLPRGQLIFVVLKKPKQIDSQFNGRPTKIFEIEVIDLDGNISTKSVTAKDYKDINKKLECVKDIMQKYGKLPLCPYVRPQSMIPFNAGR